MAVTVAINFGWNEMRFDYRMPLTTKLDGKGNWKTAGGWIVNRTVERIGLADFAICIVSGESSTVHRTQTHTFRSITCITNLVTLC